MDLSIMRNLFQFPVTAYVKENGFLGLAAYNEEDDSLFITTKSSPEGDYAVWLREDMNRLLGEDKLEKIKQFSKENDVTFVFECVDMDRDPHIIEYPESRIYLLDIVRNKVSFEKLPYDELMTVAQTIGLTYKEKAYELGSWQEFFDWYHEVLEEDYRYNGRLVEGFVVEDSAGFMVKLKLTYYNFWKFMRSIAHETVKKGYVDPRRTSSLTTPLANAFYGWIK